MDDLEMRFHDEMLNVYKRAKAEAGYTASLFLGMVVDRGGVATARYLLDSPKVSDGYTALWQRGRLDLSVEAVILERRWWPLFDSGQRKSALSREFGRCGKLICWGGNTHELILATDRYARLLAG